MVPERELDIVAASHSKVQIQVEETKPWRWITGAAVFLIAAVIAGLGSLQLLRRHQAIPLDAKDSVLVADFTNLTGDPVFDHALRQGLELQLQQSPYLNLVSEDRIQQTLRLMGQAPETVLTGQVAREVCLRTGTTGMLEASIQNVGARYVLILRATNCSTGDVIDREQAQVTRKEEVLEAIGRAVGNQEKARQICEAWAATYPRELLPHSFLSGFIDLVLANYDQAIEEAWKGIAIAPDYSYLYFLLGEDSLYLGRLNDAEGPCAAHPILRSNIQNCWSSDTISLF